MHHKILFVCLGNICRSPLAEGILLKLVEKYQLPVHVDSAGTANYHVGEAPDKRTVKNAGKNGVDLSLLRARQFHKEDFENFDRIYVMDKNNYSHVLSLSSKEQHKKKVDLFLNTMYAGTNLEVPDPYYGDESDFEKVFHLLYNACENLCLKLKEN